MPIQETKIIPTILAQNKQGFERKIKKIKKLGFKIAQLDICDNCFVKNKTYFDFDNNLDFELHLMVKNPESIIKQVKNYKNIKRIIFHFEAVKNIKKIINLIKKYNFQAGLAINPETPVFKIKKYLKYLDLILVMSVHPGFSGQKFIPETFQKIKKLRKINKKILIEVDGGINKKVALKIIKAGANVLAVGSCLENFV
ncbi:MAG: ribulose-phosphate 3-epimerase [bacterium]